MLGEEIDDYGVMRTGSTLVIQRWLPGPAERIWRYLTDSDLRSKWLAAGQMDPAPGNRLDLVWRNDDLSDITAPRPEGIPAVQTLESRVSAFDPPRLLSFAWGKGDVTIELREQGDRVLLTLTHRGLDDASTRPVIAAGWHMHLDILGMIAAGEKPVPFWPGWERLRDDYRARLPG